MAVEKVTWKTEKDNVVFAGEFEVDIPDSLADCEERFGAETVRMGFKKSAVIYLQAYARREATKEENPKTPAEIAAAIPGIKIAFSEREAADPVEKILATFGKLTPERREALIASLTESLATS